MTIFHKWLKHKPRKLQILEHVKIYLKEVDPYKQVSYTINTWYDMIHQFLLFHEWKKKHLLEDFLKREYYFTK